MLSATCHCGAVRVEVPRRPRQLTNCNCSICRRYGTLWTYYPCAQVQVSGETTDYVWGDGTLRFARCSTCGCVMYWSPLGSHEGRRMGVNMRNFDPEAVGAVRIRRLDGALTWKFID